MFNLLFVIFSAVVAYALGKIISLLESIDQKLSAKPEGKANRKNGFQERLEAAIKEKERIDNKITNSKNRAK